MVLKQVIVGIDDGHGMKDPTNTKENPGKRTPLFKDGHYVLENVFNRGAANYFEKACRRHGLTALQLAPEDFNVSLDERVRRANAWGCNIVVSWHYNAYRGNWDETKGGISVHYQNGAKDAEKLAGCVLKYLLQGTKQVSRGIVADDLMICRETKGTAILIESGFMDVMAEAMLMDQEWYWIEQAEQAMQGLCEYMGIQYIPDNTGGEENMDKAVVTFEAYHDHGAAEILAYLLHGECKHVSDLTDAQKNTTGQRYAIGMFKVYSVPAGFTPIRGTDRADTLLQVLKVGGRID